MLVSVRQVQTGHKTEGGLFVLFLGLGVPFAPSHPENVSADTFRAEHSV